MPCYQVSAIRLYMALLLSLSIFGAQGNDGDLVVNTGDTVAIDSIRASVTRTSMAGQPVLNVIECATFNPGDVVLILQMTGPSAGISEGQIVASTDTQSGTLTLTKNLSKTYTVDLGNTAQVLRVPQYGNVMIQPGGTLTCSAWDGASGGVLAFNASGTVDVEGAIDVSGKGFQGGVAGIGAVGGGGGSGGSFFGSGGGAYYSWFYTTGRAGGSGTMWQNFNTGGPVIWYGYPGNYGGNGGYSGYYPSFQVNSGGEGLGKRVSSPLLLTVGKSGDAGNGGIGGVGAGGGGAGGARGNYFHEGLNYDQYGLVYFPEGWSPGGSGGNGGDGGSGGSGGNGGGVIVVSCNQIIGNGSILSQGVSGIAGTPGGDGGQGGSGGEGEGWDRDDQFFWDVRFPFFYRVGYHFHYGPGGGGGGGNGGQAGAGGGGGSGGDGGRIVIAASTNLFGGELSASAGMAGAAGTNGTRGYGGAGGLGGYYGTDLGQDMDFASPTPGRNGYSGSPGPAQFSLPSAGQRGADGLMSISAAPIVSISGAPAVVNIPNPVNLAAVAFDPHLIDTLTYAWSVSYNGGAFRTLGTDETLSFAPDQTGPCTVMLEVTNSEGFTGSATADFFVSLGDPVAIAGPDQTLEAGDGAVATFNLDGSNSTDPNGPLTYIWSGQFFEGGGTLYGPTAQATLPIGVYPVTLTVTNIYGQTSTSVVTLTVQHTLAPIFSTPPDPITVEQVDYNGTLVAIPDIVAWDSIEIPTVTNDSASLYPNGFQLGANLVTYTAQDSYGLTATVTLVVTVVDTTMPTFTIVPIAQTIEANRIGGADQSLVDLNAFAVDICDADVKVTNDAPLVFPLGDTVVTFTATDASGNFATTPVTITVTDTTPPVFDLATVPGPIVAEQSNLAGTEVFVPLPDANDLCDGPISVTIDAPDVFNLGDTLVTFTATDISGNSSTVTTVVTVHDTTPPVLANVPAPITVEQTNGGGTSVPAIASSSVARFVQVGSIAPRDVHSAVLLKNGKVLAVGGALGGPSSGLSSSEIYDPTTRTWSNAADMATSRYYFTLTLLQNGKVLAAGGGGAGYSAIGTAELYDPATNSWSSAGALATPRYLHTATLLANGKVLIAAGIDGLSGFYTNSALNSAELYDPVTNSWSSAGVLTEGRRLPSANLLPNGNVLVAGGYNENGYLASAEIYDSITNTWTATASMTDARYEASSATLQDGKVLIAGGDIGTPLSSAELYDPATNSWSPAGSMSAGRTELPMVLLPDGKVLMAGGYGYSEDTADIYDPVSNSWSPTANLLEAHYANTATLLPDGDVLIAGGINLDGVCELYTSSTKGLIILPTATDICDTAPTVTYNGPATFPLGQTQVSFTASDVSGNVSAPEFTTVTVVDTTPPYFTFVPAPVTIEQSDLAGTPFTLEPALAADICDAGPIVSSDAPTTFPLGATTVTFTATDGSGNTTKATTTVTVVDTTPPAFPDAVEGQLAGVTLDQSTHAGAPSTKILQVVPAANMNFARGFQASALLSNGKLLTAGGYSGGSLVSSELYDPVAKKWTVTGDLNGPRHNCTAVTLTNGKVLMVGGDNSSFVSYAATELYDPATGVWTNTGVMSAGRELPTLVLLQNGHALVAGGLNGAAPQSSAETYDSNTGVWTPVASMAHARYLPEAARLQDGRVLVAGGSELTLISAAEIYNPSTNVWTPVADMHYARQQGTATLLNDGRVIVVGGYGFGQVANQTAEIFNPATGVWTDAAPPSFPHAAHTAVKLPDGKVVVAGDYYGATGVEVYDPIADSWTSVGDLSAPRTTFTANLLTDGTVLFVGSAGVTCDLFGVSKTVPVVPMPTIADICDVGAVLTSDTPSVFPLGPNTVTYTATDAAGNVSRVTQIVTVTDTTPPVISNVTATLTVEQTSRAGTIVQLIPNGQTLPTTPAFTVAEEMISARSLHVAAQLHDGRVLLAGGDTSAEIFNPTTQTFSPTGEMHVARYYATATTLNDGRVLIAGGTQSPGTGTLDLANCEIYDPTTGQFSLTGDMNTARYNHTATLLNDGTVLVTGAQEANNTISSAETFNPATGVWTLTANDMSSQRGAHTATLLPNGKVLLAGGALAVGVQVQSADLYDPVTRLFTPTGDLHVARYYHLASLLPNGKVLVAGGSGYGSQSSANVVTSELYDPSTGLWTLTGDAPFATERPGSGSRLSNGNFLIVLDSSSAVYDWLTGTYSAGPTLNYARGGDQTMTLLQDGRVLVAGGGSQIAELYGIPTNGPRVLTLPTVSDICDSAPIFTNDAPAIFPLGSTTVTYTATDASGNVSQATTLVNVIDTTPPVFTNIPGPFLLEQTDSNGTPFDVPLPVAFDVCDAGAAATVSSDQALNFPNGFPLGTSIVTFTAMDQSGNLATTTTTVTVKDTTPPVFTFVPDPVTIEQSNHNGTPFTFPVMATAADICDAAPIVTSDAPATFPLGPTTVTFTAKDHSGNQTTTTTTVNVVDTTPPVFPAGQSDKLIAIVPTGGILRIDTRTPGSEQLELNYDDATLDGGRDTDGSVYGAFSPAGDLFIATRKANIARYSDPIRNLTLGGIISDPAITYSIGVVFRNNELFVSNYDTGIISRYIIDGFGNATFNGEINDNPLAIRNMAVSPWGELFVAETTGTVNRYTFDVAGNATYNGAISDASLNEPHFVTFSPWGELFVSNTLGSTLTRFVFDASHNATYNGQVSSPDLVGPMGMAFGSGGDLFVCSYYIPQIVRFKFDAAHNATEQNVIPTPAPMAGLLVPAPLQYSVEQTSAAGTPFTVPMPVATDICDATPPVVSDAPLVFPLGSTPVTFTATDSSGNTSNAYAIVTVVDTTPPVFTFVPAATIVQRTDFAGTPVTLAAAAASDICDTMPTVTNDAPALFPLGVTTVTFTAVDGSGNKATATTVVTIIDTVPPDTFIDSTPNAISSQTSAVFTFHADKQGCHFERKLDGGAWTPTTSPETVSGLKKGVHTYSVRAIDDAGNVDATPAAYTWFIDLTAPVAGKVFDGPGAQLKYLTVNNTFTANWSGFSDPESAVVGYEWAIGTSKGLSNIQPFTGVGLVTSATTTGLSLSNGQIYYTTVRATNGAGLQTTVSSTGVIVDTTPPSGGTVSIGSGAPWQSSKTSMTAAWINIKDSESGIAKYEWAIGTQPGFTDVQPFVSTGLVKSGIASSLSLSQGATYYVTVRSTNGAGLSSIINSPAVMVDSITPTAGSVNDGLATDISFQSSTTTLSANWNGFSAQSGIAKYEWAIGTSAGGTDVQSFKSVGLALTASNSGLSAILTTGVKYFITVRATSGSGLTVNASSDGVTEDKTAPVAGTVVDNGPLQLLPGSKLGTISASWGLFSDPESGIAKYEWAIGTSIGGSNTLPFTAVGLNTSATTTLSLAQGGNYYVTIRATNGAGKTITATSAGVKFDGTPPSAGTVTITTASPTTVAATWSNFKDTESNVTQYEWAIGKTAGASDVRPFTVVGLAGSASVTGAFTVGQTYFVTIRATNGVGLTVTKSSPGVKAK